MAEAAGLRSIHSQRTAHEKAPDRIAWMFRIVFGDIGLHRWGLHPALAQS